MPEDFKRAVNNHFKVRNQVLIGWKWESILPNPRERGVSNWKTKEKFEWFDKNNYYMANSMSGQEEPNPVLWLATRADKIPFSCPLWIARCVLLENVLRRRSRSLRLCPETRKKELGVFSSGEYAWNQETIPVRINRFSCVSQDEDGENRHGMR